jgi:hypothetical protein
MALMVTLMVMLLASVLMVGFVAAIIADQRSSGLDRDQTQAYAVAHAGLEQLTSDLSGLFTADFSPGGPQIQALAATPPTIPGFQFIAPGGGSGYAISYNVDAQGNPRPADVNGTVISAGPYQGFRGIITPYDITVTARSRGGAEVRMRRTLQTVAVPVFQFGMFSETDLAFHAGEPFGFGGRVHTNGNLFLAQGGGSTLTLADRITAVQEVIRTHLPNGLAVGSGYAGTVRAITAPNVYRNLLTTEGSLVGTLGSSQNEPKWTQVSVGTYNSNIRNGRTGARRLDLPLVSQGARPVDLIRRPAMNSNEDTANPLVHRQRFFAQASVRILLSDTPEEIQRLPTVTQGTQPVRLYTPWDNYVGYVDLVTPTTPPLGSYERPGEVFGSLPGSVYKGQHNESVLGGYIKIEMQRQNGTWLDVTKEILSLGIAGRNLADLDRAIPGRWNSLPSGAADTCPEPNPNAVIRLQRVRDVTHDLARPCGVTVVGGIVTAVSPNDHDYWPLTLYDPREGHVRDGLANTTTDLVLGGVMHYVELDVNNLRRWILGQIGVNGPQAKLDNGYIVYFSDRRNNKNDDPTPEETGEFGWEETVNLNTAVGTPNGVLDPGEDSNANGTLERYGRLARNVPVPADAGPGRLGADVVAPGFPNPLHSGTLVTDRLTDASLGIGFPVGPDPNTQVPVAVPAYVKPLVARANRPLFFRRALKIVNGGINGGVNSIIAPGLTIAAENPVYLQGNYNATATSVVQEPNVASAVIADSVTMLSNAWNDIQSFLTPGNSDASVAAGRRASTTGYRVAIVSGKTLPFPLPAFADQSFGSDGGAHNFLRLLEDWDTPGATFRYRGSLVSFFISRQANGSFKCCQWDVYKRGTREVNFDTDFLTPTLLPPGTPMFRDINTLTFRQLLRPTQ